MVRHAVSHTNGHVVYYFVSIGTMGLTLVMEKASHFLHSCLIRGLELLWSVLVKAGASEKVRSFVGHPIHWLVRKYQDRYVSEYTRFFRNQPQLDVLLQLSREKIKGSEVRLAVLGCSNGAELYSAIWTIRSTRPDLNVRSVGLDISASAIDTACKALYARDGDEMRDVTDEIREAMFEIENGMLKVKGCVRQGATLMVEDAGNPQLPARLGPQDYVIASNFLIHLPNQLAETCLLNIARLVTPGGYVFVWGVDLDIKTRIMKALKMEPVMQNLEDIHMADKRAREVWPLKWWGLEPLDKNRPDWKVRYCTVFRKPASASGASNYASSHRT